MWWRWEVADEGVDKRRRASRQIMDRIISRRESLYELVCLSGANGRDLSVAMDLGQDEVSLGVLHVLRNVLNRIRTPFVRRLAITPLIEQFIATFL